MRGSSYNFINIRSKRQIPFYYSLSKLVLLLFDLSDLRFKYQVPYLSIVGELN